MNYNSSFHFKYNGKAYHRQAEYKGQECEVTAVNGTNAFITVGKDEDVFVRIEELELLEFKEKPVLTLVYTP